MLCFRHPNFRGWTSTIVSEPYVATMDCTTTPLDDSWIACGRVRIREQFRRLKCSIQRGRVSHGSICFQITIQGKGLLGSDSSEKVPSRECPSKYSKTHFLFLRLLFRSGVVGVLRLTGGLAGGVRPLETSCSFLTTAFSSTEADVAELKGFRRGFELNKDGSV